ncbi:MAG: hypothetical protein LKG19_11720 [Saprospiraceae bacterium]|jgi:hypothetical protein|nr:hypothetical protein [Saprospiraceae bacterium]
MNETKIAGLKNVSQWKELRNRLKSEPSEKLWRQAFDDFLHARVKTRYFDPIDAISKIPAQQGKGFSIITIYCSLIEFFETQLKGYYFENRNYKNIDGFVVKSETRKDKKGKLNPISTEEVFVHFLTENEPFKSHFTNLLAKDFYKNVRYAILHQAETSGNWIVKDGKDSDPIVVKDKTTNILHWKPFKKNFEIFLKDYGESLRTDTIIQRNFVFKWNKISSI